MAENRAFVSNLLVCKTQGEYAIIANEGEEMTNSTHEEPKDVKRLRTARRSMMYVVRSLLLVILAVILLVQWQQ